MATSSKSLQEAKELSLEELVDYISSLNKQKAAIKEKLRSLTELVSLHYAKEKWSRLNEREKAELAQFIQAPEIKE